MSSLTLSDITLPSVNSNNSNKSNQSCKSPKLSFKNIVLQQHKKRQKNNNNYKHIRSQSKKKRKSFGLKDSLDLIPKLSNDNQTETQLLKILGYKKSKKIADTIQGSIWESFNILYPNKKLIIKVVDKIMHQKGIGKKGDKIFVVDEDILKEKYIHQLISKSNPTKEFTEYKDFFQNDTNYYLITEHGGTDLYNHVVSCHERIANNELTVKEWRHHCRLIFSQMINGLIFLHNKMNICHFDISLENFLISNNQIKYIDFGLSETFKNNDDSKTDNIYLSSKHVGKVQYQSPECFKKSTFDARLNDIWSLGVVLFSILVGAPPYKYPGNRDDNFKAIMSGQLKYLLSEYGRVNYMSKYAYDLLRKIFQKEKKRITLDKLIKHDYIRGVLKKKQQQHTT